jgi:hypothetical protein
MIPKKGDGLIPAQRGFPIPFLGEGESENGGRKKHSFFLLRFPLKTIFK